jgi:sucrose-6-phosphate hydrolase SacC (GH32 family)
MVYPTALDADSRCFDWDAPHRRVGGTLAPPPGEGGALGLRILVDHSAVEVFTDGGQALATRRAIPCPAQAGQALMCGKFTDVVR